MNGKILIALTCLSLGCAAGMAYRPQAVAQNFAPSRAAQRWQQLCEDYADHDEMKAAVRRFGSSGWELVTLTFSSSNHPWLCYRRAER